MKYVDGFIIPVPKKKLATYKKWAKICSKVWLEHGAIEYVETVGDDVPMGKVTSFPRSVKLKSDEVVVYSWIVYKSRAARQKASKTVMKDPRLAGMMDPKKMPFDGKRMIFGGFVPFLDVRKK
ncbi:MAG: DUF1428 domain-containing protein [Sandaracinaceae bacterium]|nr:DUF1428 domain-containing protein [Sandaracinaceae bacterium]